MEAALFLGKGPAQTKTFCPIAWEYKCGSLCESACVFVGVCCACSEAGVQALCVLIGRTPDPGAGPPAPRSPHWQHWEQKKIRKLTKRGHKRETEQERVVRAVSLRKKKKRKTTVWQFCLMRLWHWKSKRSPNLLLKMAPWIISSLNMHGLFCLSKPIDSIRYDALPWLTGSCMTYRSTVPYRGATLKD